MDDVQRLEAERLRPVPPPSRPDPVDGVFRRVIGLIAGVCQDAGMLPPRSCPADCVGTAHDKACWPQPERNRSQ